MNRLRQGVTQLDAGAINELSPLETRPATGAPETVASPSTAVQIAGINLAHPILSAAGPLGFGRELQAVFDLRTFAGFVTKSVTVEAREGNPRPQVIRTEAGWLNSVGLTNPGLAMFLTRELPFLRTLGIPIIVSIAGESLQEFETLAEWLSGERDVAGLELNVSCPNVESGLDFGVDPKLTHDLVRLVRTVTPLPLFVKLTPNVGDITVIARAAEDAGADGLSVINAVLGMAIDVTTRRSKLGTPTGGLSGPGIKPIAIRMVWQVARACRLPIVGVGGITTAEDVVEFLLAGAQAVAVGSAAIDRPQIASELQTGLTHYLIDHGLANVRNLVGAVDVEGVEGRTDL